MYSRANACEWALDHRLKTGTENILQMSAFDDREMNRIAEIWLRGSDQDFLLPGF